jgi:2-dehydro-3-deoxy-D-arabinonate dehydratase
MAAAIAMARVEGRSLHELLSELGGSSAHRVEVDLAAVVVRDGDQTQPIGVPVDAPEIWAAGVTYVESRDAREFESGERGREFYRRIYDAERPEVFLKDAGGRRTVASGEPIGVRGDSNWSVPEPELGVVIDASGAIVGYTIGNDVSARDIEGANPLYLPQAKIFSASCALGPLMLVKGAAGSRVPEFEITLRIRSDDDRPKFEGRTSTGSMRRSFEELVSYVLRYNRVGDGTVVLTGTGLVPPDDVTLEEGDVVEVEVPGLGTLRNVVKRLSS